MKDYIFFVFLTSGTKQAANANKKKTLTLPMVGRF